MKGKEPIRVWVSMFNEFSITVDNHSAREKDNRSHQLWHFLQILIEFRHKPLPHKELVNLLWPNSKPLDSRHSLHQLAYQLRVFLGSYGINNAEELIISYNRSYRWNNDIPANIDTEQLEHYYNNTVLPKASPKEIKKAYKEILLIYKGKYLSRSGFRPWIKIVQKKYHSMFLNVAEALIDIYVREKNYEEAEITCKKVMEIDLYSELAHKKLITCLLLQEEKDLALTQYAYAKELLSRDETKVSSIILIDSHHELREYFDDNQITVALSKPSKACLATKAFFCDYDSFMKFRCIEKRFLISQNKSVFSLLIEITHDTPNLQNSALEIAKAVDILRDVLFRSLIERECFALKDSTKYEVLLNIKNKKEYDKRVKVIESRFYYRCRKLKIKLIMEAKVKTGRHNI